jgi:hypothetical protein
MLAIDINIFIVFCKTLIGQNLKTVEGKSQFILNNVTGNAFYYQVSTKNVQKQAIRYVDRVLKRYTKTRSLNPGHYGDITPNGLCVLTLIKLYEESLNK